MKNVDHKLEAVLHISGVILHSGLPEHMLCYILLHEISFAFAITAHTHTHMHTKMHIGIHEHMTTKFQ